MGVLEDCITPYCVYKLEFDDFAKGKRELSSGDCPHCGARCVVFCPDCDKAQVTRDYLRNGRACFYCEKELDKLAEKRRGELRIEGKRIYDFSEESHLSPREIEVVKLLARGQCNKEVAANDFPR